MGQTFEVIRQGTARSNQVPILVARRERCLVVAIGVIIATRIDLRERLMERPSGEHTALGFRVHSGWAALAVLTGPVDSPMVVDRKRIDIADAHISGSKQPYHAAGAMKLEEAKTLIQACTESSTRLATDGVQAAIADAKLGGYRVSAAGVLTSSGRPLPALEKILSSHPLLHTAEGELFRHAILSACESCGLALVTVKEKELLGCCPRKLGVSDAAVLQHLARMGRAVGSPWRQDEKFAALAAWIAMAEETQK